MCGVQAVGDPEIEPRFIVCLFVCLFVCFLICQERLLNNSSPDFNLCKLELWIKYIGIQSRNLFEIVRLQFWNENILN